MEDLQDLYQPVSINVSSLKEPFGIVRTRYGKTEQYLLTSDNETGYLTIKLIETKESHGRDRTTNTKETSG